MLARAKYDVQNKCVLPTQYNFVQLTSMNVVKTSNTYHNII